MTDGFAAAAALAPALGPWVAALTNGLQTTALIGWAVIVVWGKARAWRALAGRAERGDWVAVAMVLLGLVIATAMLLYLTGTMTPFRRAMVLVGITATPVLIILGYSASAQEGHKRAVVRSIVALLGLSFVAGTMV